jgi:hypothetical protein
MQAEAEYCVHGYVRKPDGRIPRGEPTRRVEDYNKIYFQNKIGGRGLDKCSSGQERVAGCRDNGNKPSGAIQ